MPSLSDLNIPGYDAASGAIENPTPSTPTNNFINKLMAATSNQPGMGTLAGTSILRTANTVLYGGWMGQGAEDLRPMFRWGKDAAGNPKGHGFVSHYSPRTMFRHPTQKVFDAEPAYNPFASSSIGNSAIQFGAKHNERIAKALVDNDFFSADEIGAIKSGEKGARLHGFEGGFLGKMTAGRRLDRSIRGSANLTKNLMNMTKNTQQVISEGRNGAALAEMAASGNLSYEQALGLSSRGVLGRGMSGFMMGASGEMNQAKEMAVRGAGGLAERGLAAGTRLAAQRAEFAGGEYGMRATGQIVAGAAKKAAMETALKTVAKEGLEGAAKETVLAAAEKGLTSAGVKAGTSALAGIGVEAAAGLADFWNPIGWALMIKSAYDITKMGGTLVKSFIIDPAAKLGKDAIRSFKGSSTKGIMGQGFTETAATITNRQRGVAAIQNSRLNARSILGNEGAQMHAHFG